MILFDDVISVWLTDLRLDTSTNRLKHVYTGTQEVFIYYLNIKFVFLCIGENNQ
jgi:hypothetical protein